MMEHLAAAARWVPNRKWNVRVRGDALRHEICGSEKRVYQTWAEYHAARARSISLNAGITHHQCTIILSPLHLHLVPTTILPE